MASIEEIRALVAARLVAAKQLIQDYKDGKS